MEEVEEWQTCVLNWCHDEMGVVIEEEEMCNFLAVAVAAVAGARDAAGQRNGSYWYSYCYS